MIIDKTKAYWTEESLRRVEDILKEQDSLTAAFDRTDIKDTEALNENTAAYQALENELTAIRQGLAARYAEDHTPAEVLADVKEIVDAIDPTDFQAYLTARMESLAELGFTPNGKRWPRVEDRLRELSSNTRADPAIIARIEEATLNAQKTMIALLERATAEDYDNCYEFITFKTVTQLNALSLLGDTQTYDSAIKYIEERAAQWYEKPAESPYAPFEPADLTPSVLFSYPDTHLQNLTKASDSIFDHKLPAEALHQVTLDLDVSPTRNKTGTTYSVIVEMNAPELKGTENMTEFDGSVFNAAISLAQGNKHGFFTAKQIATHLLYGDNQNGNNPSQQRIGAVTKSIEKQRHIDITIDWTQHAKLNKMVKDEDTLESFKIKGYMLPVNEYTAIVNGQKITGYQIIGTPPLYEYARQVQQIATHPAKMLNVPVNLDEQRIVMRDFLLREIGHMKSRSSWNKTITVDRIMSVAGVGGDDVTRKKKSQLVAAIRRMLDYWKSEKYIKGYRENKKGKAIYSYTIETL